MHAKKRNNRVNLYRTHYVRKGEKGNTHGYNTPEFVGSLPAGSKVLPSVLAARLTPAECEFVMRKIVEHSQRRMEGETSTAVPAQPGGRDA
ncbi:hypothetical protein JJQ59_04690 [Cupriavidus necator]|uniref:hypothetical protein n=1 Tax=Cupriavidus necator TaxID=106590 RepID=UPI0011BE65A5|nr:hypothetical protein [Cupriavidus necator]QQX85246.1 hypothetical protein JJQ59_04690 [Cupriavidus necator]